jgi:hypothetical protein
MNLAESNPPGQRKLKRKTSDAAKRAFAVVSAVCALAQPYEILPADYGYGNRAVM